MIEARGESPKVAAAYDRPVLFVAVGIADHGIEEQIAGENVPRRERFPDTHRWPHVLKRLTCGFERVAGAVTTHDRFAKEFVAVQQRFTLRQNRMSDGSGVVCSPEVRTQMRRLVGSLCCSR